MEQGAGNRELGFRQLIAWQKADDLAAEVYTVSSIVRKQDRWLADQIWHAAFSVTANIAEGYGRSSLPDYLRFLEIAGASLNEVENAIHSFKRNMIVPAEKLQTAEELRAATGNLLFGLMRSLRKKAANKGDWQRGIREPGAEYGFGDGVEAEFQVPSSQFLASTTDSTLSGEAHDG